MIETKKGGMVYLPVKDLHPHPDNPRKDVGDVSELAESIKVNGVLQNLTVVPNMVAGEITGDTWQRGYKVIIDHRRLAAVQLVSQTESTAVAEEAEVDEAEQIGLEESGGAE